MMGSQETTLRLAPIPPRVHNLLSQLAFRPRRLASRVPLAQRANRLDVAAAETIVSTFIEAVLAPGVVSIFNALR